MWCLLIWRIFVLELFEAIRKGQIDEIWRLIIRHNINLNDPNIYLDGSPPLHVAIKNNQLGVAEALCKIGASVVAKDKNGITALHWAAYKGGLEIIQLLMAQPEADAAVTTIDGSALLHFAAWGGDLSITRYLVEHHKVNVATKDNEGWTALHLAIVYKKADIMHYLIRHQDCIGSDLTSLPWSEIDVGGLMLIGATVRYVATLAGWRLATRIDEEKTLGYSIARSAVRPADMYFQGLIEKAVTRVMGVNIDRGFQHRLITREFLQKKGAKNAALAVTSYEEWLEAIKDGVIRSNDTKELLWRLENLEKKITYEPGAQTSPEDIEIYQRFADLRKREEWLQMLHFFRIKHKPILLDAYKRPTNTADLSEVDKHYYRQIANGFVCRNNIVGLKKLLKEVPIDLEQWREPILLSAFENKAYECVEYLTENGINLKWRDTQGDNLLHYAARSERSARRLIDLPSFMKNSSQSYLCLINEKNHVDENCLHVLAEHGYYFPLRKLKELGIFAFQRNQRDETALHVAIRRQRTAFVVEFMSVFQLYQSSSPLDLLNVTPYCRNLVTTAVRYYHRATFDALQTHLPLAVLADETRNKYVSGINAIEDNRKSLIQCVAESPHAIEIRGRLHALGAMFENQNARGIDVEHLLKPQILPLDQQAHYLAYLRSRPLKHKIRYLVFQGGGPKGIAYLGALEELEKHGVDLQKIEQVGGASTGAITAFLLAIGYDATEIRQLLDALPIEEFLDDNVHRETLFSLIKDKAGLRGKLCVLLKAEFKGLFRSEFSILSQLRKRKGLFPGEKLRLWLEDRIVHKISPYFGGDRDQAEKRAKLVTFRGLAQLKNDGYPVKLLKIIGSDISSNPPRAETFAADNDETSDDIIVDAVRISLSVPGLFIPHKRRILKPSSQIVETKEHLYVDGGVFYNYPIKLFDFNHYLHDDNPLKLRGSLGVGIDYNNEVLGLRLLEDKALLEAYEKVQAPAEQQITTANEQTWIALWQLLKPLAEAFTSDAQQESIHMNSNDRSRTVYISALDVTLFNFNLTETQKSALMEEGRKGVNNYFRRVNPGSTLKPDFIFKSPQLIDLLQKELLYSVPKLTGKSVQANITHEGTLYFNYSLNYIDDHRLIGELLKVANSEERQYLQVLGLNLNVRNRQGQTSLHTAIADVNYERFYAILQTEAGRLSSVMLDNAGISVLDMAYQLPQTTLRQSRIRDEFIRLLVRGRIS